MVSTATPEFQQSVDLSRAADESRVLGEIMKIGFAVRIPAAWCGLAAHTPSMDLVPLTGHFPMDRGPGADGAALARYLAPGPMRRAVGICGRS